jgi:hypothetical protein
MKLTSNPDTLRPESSAFRMLLGQSSGFEQRMKEIKVNLMYPDRRATARRLALYGHTTQLANRPGETLGSWMSRVKVPDRHSLDARSVGAVQDIDEEGKCLRVWHASLDCVSWDRFS